MLFVTKKIKHAFLDSCARIRTGSIRLRTPEGEVFDFGSGTPQGQMHIHDWSVVAAMASRGDIGLGEAYVAGLWDTPSISDLISVGLLNKTQFSGFDTPGFWSVLKYRMVNRLLRANTTRGAARNIRAHYDVGNAFYQLWLDPGMTYSSALFAPGDRDLERGQARKYDRILNRLSPGERVLEIGCGWGGFAERATDSGRHVTGLTISPSQKGYADARLEGRADIRLQDYRDSDGRFDNIVSIEMIEAVGESYWPEYFVTLKRRLSENGRAVIQAITVPDNYFSIYRKSSDYIRHYTFPGGMLLSNQVIADQAQRAGLMIRDSFAFGPDYAATCQAWSDRIDVKRAQITRLGYDLQFIRNWKFYLEICAASFATAQTDVVQVELSHGPE